MTYDHWKTTNPDDEFGENAEQPSNFVERCCSTQRPAFTPENIREAIDAAFNERGLHIDWELRNSIVDKIMAAPALQETDQSMSPDQDEIDQALFIQEQERTDRAPIGGTESCTCHFFGAGTHHAPGCPYYMIDEYRYRPRTSERLVEILRSFEYGPRSWQSEAADEIERLRKALQEIADGKNPADD